MTVTEKNIQRSLTIIVPLVTSFCLAAPIQAQEVHLPVNLQIAIDDCQECGQELVYQELESREVANLPKSQKFGNLNIQNFKVINSSQPASLPNFKSLNSSQPASLPNFKSLNSSQPSKLSADFGMGTAQLPNQTPLPQSLPPIITPPQPQVPSTPQPLPPPGELLKPSTPTSPTNPQVPSETVPKTFTVRQFKFEGNTAFSSQELSEKLKDFIGRPLTFAELLEARSVVTQLYIKNGYATSGAFIPEQTLEGGVVSIRIVEGSLEDIKVNGLRRLNPSYVRSRLGLAGRKPLNVERLLDGLRLLQLDPLIANLSAELSAGSQPGSSLLTVTVKEADTFSIQLLTNNDRPPSIGSFRRGFEIREANLLGLGDGIGFTYGNTDGSDDVNLSYTLPINAHNGTINFSYTNTPSRVIEPPFEILDINASSRYYDLTYRQPVSQTPNQEFALGLTLSRRESEITVLGIPYPLSAGADENGRTTVNALRFTQEYTKRTSQQVIAARSQFSFGLGILDSTINSRGPDNSRTPDSRFFSWRGQAQWVRLLGANTLFLLRGDLQLADRPLVPLEQYGLGGRETLRGYRQDIFLSDNGANLSAEVRVPILRIPQWKTLLQLAPFVDFGTVWNSGGIAAPNPSTLAGAGLGLQLQVANNLTARFDYGIPIVYVKSRSRTWQENGLYFSILWNPF